MTFYIAVVIILVVVISYFLRKKRRIGSSMDLKPKHVLMARRTTPVLRHTGIAPRQIGKSEDELLEEFFTIVNGRNMLYRDEIDLEYSNQSNGESHSNPEDSREPEIFERQDDIGPNLLKIDYALSKGKYLSFEYENCTTIILPTNMKEALLIGKCFLFGAERHFSLPKLKHLRVRDSVFIDPPNHNHSLANRLDFAQSNHMLIRMKYEKSDFYAGQKLLEDVNHGEDPLLSIRTIGNIRNSLDALTPIEISEYKLNESYITAYCFLRNARRTFKISRILSLDILNI